MIHRYSVIYEPAEEGGYIVHVPALPGCVTEGDTLEEAREMAKDAVRGYLEMLAKHGEEIPIEPTGAVYETVLVSLSPLLYECFPIDCYTKAGY